MGVELAHFLRREVFMGHFHHLAGDHLKIYLQQPEKHLAARRS